MSGTRLIIAGSRDLFGSTSAVWQRVSLRRAWRRICEALDEDVTLVLSGGCRGADTEGENLAKGLGIPVKTFPADWETHGRAAGPIRNAEMASHADALLLLGTGKTPGSASMLKEAKKRKLKILVHEPVLSDISGQSLYRWGAEDTEEFELVADFGRVIGRTIETDMPDMPGIQMLALPEFEELISKHSKHSDTQFVYTNNFDSARARHTG